MCNRLTGCRIAHPETSGGAQSVAVDAGVLPEEQECEPTQYNVEGYAILSCSPQVTTEGVLQMFSENRYGLFMRLVQQAQELGYDIEVGQVGVQETPARDGQYHTLGTKAVENLPSNLARALSMDGDMRTQLYVKRLGYRDPLDEVRLQGTAALSIPVSHNKQKKLSIASLVIEFHQDPTDPGKIIVEIVDWMRQGKVVWSKSYDTRNFRDQGVSYEALDGERLLQRIVEDVNPVIKAYRLPAHSDVAGAMQGGFSEIEFYAPQLVSVVEGGAKYCVAPNLFPAESMHIHTVESGLADAFRPISAASQLRGTVVSLDTPSQPHSVLVDGQIGRLTWSKPHSEKDLTHEEYTDKYYNLVNVSRNKAGEVIGVSVALAPNFAENIYRTGDPLFSEVKLELPDLGGDFSPCVQQRLIYPNAVSRKSGHRLFSLTHDAAVTAMVEHFDEAAEIITEMESSLGLPLTSVVAGIVVSSDVRTNGFIHPQFPQYMFLTDELVQGFLSSGDVGRSRFHDVVRHETVHVIDFKYGISDHAAIISFFGTVAGHYDDQFFAALNESHFIENGFGGHSFDNPKEFLASLVNSVMRPDWQQGAMLLSERLRHIYYHGLRAVSASIQETVPNGGISPLFKRLKECEEFVGKSLSRPDLPLERVAFSLSEYLQQGRGVITTVTDVNIDDILSKGPIYLFRYGTGYVRSSEIQTSLFAQLKWIAENSNVRIGWIDERVYPNLAKDLFRHSDFVEVVDGKAARRFNLASSRLEKNLEFIFGKSIPEELRGSPRHIYFEKGTGDVSRVATP